jgi:hypothetical protein
LRLRHRSLYADAGSAGGDRKGERAGVRVPAISIDRGPCQWQKTTCQNAFAPGEITVIVILWR